MRILYFHQHFSTRQGATGTRSYEMAQALIKRGHSVTLVCGSYNMAKTGLEEPVKKGLRTGIVDGIQVKEIVLPYSNTDSLVKRARLFMHYALKSVGIARATEFDLIFATSTPLTAAIPGIASKLLRKRGKFVFEVRDLWPELPRAMGVVKNPIVLGTLSCLEKAAYKAADGCVALSPGIEEGIRRRSRTELPITMVPNGCDLDLFQPTKHTVAERKEALRRWLPDLRNDEFAAVFCGAHGQANGLDAVLDAAQALKSLGRKDIRLVFIGEGRLKERLRRRSIDDQLTNCTFLDPMPKSELAIALPLFDAGLMILANVPAFYYGTSPNKFFDYIAAGLPVINNYPGWLAELITHNDCGIAVPPESPTEFANALCRLADDGNRARKMGENGHRLAEREFSREKLALEFCCFLEEIGARSNELSSAGQIPPTDSDKSHG